MSTTDSVPTLLHHARCTAEMSDYHILPCFFAVKVNKNGSGLQLFFPHLRDLLDSIHRHIFLYRMFAFFFY